MNYFRFLGRGQRETFVVDVRGIVEIVMLLPGRHARPSYPNTYQMRRYGEFIPHISSDACKASRHAKVVAILK